MSLLESDRGGTFCNPAGRGATQDPTPKTRNYFLSFNFVSALASNSFLAWR